MNNFLEYVYFYSLSQEIAEKEVVFILIKILAFVST